jgi:hypothetical protein
MNQLAKSIKTLVATQNKTLLTLERIEKCMNLGRNTEEFEEEVSTEERRRVKTFEENDNYEKERRNARRYEDND